mmetsp:Transcript_19766/g.58651  ORF Transcript_19766/g.58651 Transcript_19766/m.58651 type:complete len:95 (+) Transcript_19766:91-375(+)
MSMYVRVKRRKQTFFLHVEPTDTILELKSKLQDLVQQPPERQQLLKETTVLEDAKKLADLKVENDDVLAVTFMQEDGSWEDVEITPYDPMESSR